MSRICRLSLLFVVAAAFQFAPESAFAQRDAGAKARGDYSGTFWSSRSAGRSVRHAIDYSRGAHEYVQSTPKPSPQYLRAEAAEIGKNLAAAKAEVAYLKAQAARDKDLAAAVSAIEKHLAAAEKEQQTFHAECAKESVDGKVAMDCCHALTGHLTKAHDELEALQKKLAPKPALK